MFSPVRAIASFGVVLSLCAACGSPDSGEPGAGAALEVGGGRLSARIDGELFEAPSVQAVLRDGTLSVLGSLAGTRGNRTRQLNFLVLNASVGDHAIRFRHDVTAGYVVGELAALDSYSAVSGTISIEALSGDIASGTFEFVARNGAGEQIAVTDGAYDVRLGH